MTYQRFHRGWLVTAGVLVLMLSAGCDGGSTDEDIANNCGIALGSPSNTYAKFVNTLGVHIEVEYDDIALVAVINRRSCDLLRARPNGSESFTVQRCESGDFDDEGFPVDCGFGGATRRISVTVAEGETETVTVDDNFFE